MPIGLPSYCKPDSISNDISSQKPIPNISQMEELAICEPLNFSSLLATQPFIFIRHSTAPNYRIIKFIQNGKKFHLFLGEAKLRIQLQQKIIVFS